MAGEDQRFSGVGLHAMLRALTELAPDFVVLIDRDRSIKYASPSVARVTGYTSAEMIGKPFDDFVYPEDSPLADNAFTRAVATRDVVYVQTRFRRRDGSWITLESTGRSYLDAPELEGVLVCSRDITRHIELESTLRKSAEESAALFEDAPCGYHSVDVDGVYRRVNNTEERWLQRARDELIGRMKFGDLLAPQSRSTYWQQFASLKTSGEVRNAEFDIARKDGTVFAALLQSVAVLDEGGRFVESRTTLYDITERKQAEHALRKVNRLLYALSDARRAIIVATSEPALLEAICRVLVDRGGYRFAAVHFVQHDAGSTMTLAAKAIVEPEPPDYPEVSWGDTEPGRGPIGMAVRTGKPQVNENFTTNALPAPWRDFARRIGAQSSVSVPLKDSSGVFATLSVYAGEAGAFDTEEVVLLSELAEDLAFDIESLKRAAAGPADTQLLESLSQRERDVLKLVAEGKTSKEIARRLSIAPASVDTYRSRLMFKLQVEGVAGLVRFAIRNGVIEA